mgnify:CR=1 FL=1
MYIRKINDSIFNTEVFIAVCTSSDRGYGVGITEKTHEIHLVYSRCEEGSLSYCLDHEKEHAKEEPVRRMLLDYLKEHAYA